MTDPGIFIEQSNLTKLEMRDVVMQAAEPASTQEATKLMV